MTTRCELSELLVEHCAHCLTGARDLGPERPAWLTGEGEES